MAGSPPVSLGANPFVGPGPLETGRKIFGRDREIEELYYLLSAQRIVLLYSPSGAGKSSLVQAGLIPRLWEHFDVWGPTRVNLLPTENSLGENRYVRSAKLGFESGIPTQRQRPEAELAGLTLADYVQSRPRRRGAPESVVLIFDQFEEILTADPVALDAKREFFRQLGEVLQDPRLWALFALREDYFAPLDPYARQVPTHLNSRFRLDLLNREQASDAMIETAREGGREVEPAAVTRLIDDLATIQAQQPDGSFAPQIGPYVEPLHLQVACRELWELMPAGKPVIEAVDIQLFGGVSHALADYYQRQVGGRNDEGHERAIRTWVGEKLITKEGVRSQVLRGKGSSGGLDNLLIAGLVASHLVRAEQRSGAVWYELAHDRLIEPVRTDNQQWFDAHLSKLQKTAVIWDAQGRPPGLLLLGAELTEAQSWAAAHSDLTDAERKFLEASGQAEAAADRERRQAKRLRRLAIGSAAVSIVALIALFFAWSKSREATRQSEVALAGQLLFQSERVFGEHPFDLETSALLATQSMSLNLTPDGGRVLRRALTLLPRTLLLLDMDRAALAVAFTADGRRVVSGGYSGTTVMTDVKTGAKVASAYRQDPISAIALSPDGRLVATWKASYAPGNIQGGVHVDDVASGKTLSALDHESEVLAMSFSQDGKWLAVGSADGTARVMDVAAGKEQARLTHKDKVTTVVFSPDGHLVATGSEDGTARLMDVATGKELKVITYKGRVSAVAFSPDGQLLATASDDKTAHVMRVAKGTDVATWSLQANILAMAFSPDGSRIAIGSSDQTVHVTDVAGGEVASLQHQDAVLAVAFSPDGHLVATGSADKTARIMEAATGKLLAIVPHSGAIRTLAFSPDSAWVVTASTDEKQVDGRVRVFEALPGHEISRFNHDIAAKPVSFSPDGKWVVTTDDAGTTSLMEADTGKFAARLVGSGPLRAIAFSPDGRLVATGSGGDGGTARVFEVPSGKQVAQLEQPGLNSVAFSPDGRSLVVGSLNEIGASLWELATGKTERLDFRPVGAVAFSPDGKHLAFHIPIEKESQVEVREVGSDNAAARIPLQVGVGAIAFSPDGKLLALGCDDRTVRVFNWSSGKLVAYFEHLGDMGSLTFSPDGKLFAMGGEDNTARVFDVQTGHELARIELSGTVRQVRIHPDGLLLDVLSDAALAKQVVLSHHQTDSKALLREACEKVTRNLTLEEWKKYAPPEFPYRRTCPTWP